MMAEEKKESFKFDWQRNFMKSKLAATTRLVLHALCAHMNMEGYCYPSMRKLAGETGLGLRTIVRHIGKAEKRGWLKRKRNTRPFGDQRWKNNTYQAVIPKNKAKVVPEVHHLTKGSATGAKGSATECKKVVPQRHTNNQLIKKNKDETDFSFLGEKTNSSKNYTPSKEEFDILRQKISPIANKKPKPSIDQRRAELKRQAEQILEYESKDV
jgi:DNA-binding transcriptional regulator YhcF (GntR family)